MPSPFPQMFGAPQADYEVSELPEGLRITRTSMMTRKRNTMTLPVTSAQFIRYTRGNELIQDVFPDLTPDQREFIQTGSTPEEWAAVFGEPEED